MDTRDNTKKYNAFMLDANIGLEKECLRVKEDGTLADSLHPFPGDSHIDRDFSENQLEFVTGIFDTPSAVYEEMKRLHRKAANKLVNLESGPEYMWPFSNPPRIPEGFVNTVAEFEGEAKWKTEYRNHLKEVYGTRLMLYSGIHFNFSFTDEFFEATFFDRYGAYPSESDLKNFKNQEYLDMSAWALRYSWLIVYLLSASSVLDESFFGAEGDAPAKVQPSKGHYNTSYASPRTSEIGYWNRFEPVLDYSSLDAYVDSIEKYVKDGSIMQPGELYYPVRLKNRGIYNLENLRNEGINHIELRIIDLNPCTPVGMLREDIQFLHLLMVFLMYRNKFHFNSEEQLDAIHDIKNAALYDSTLLSSAADMKTTALFTLYEMEAFFRKGPFSRIEREYIREAINFQKDKLKEGHRYSDLVRQHFGDDYQNKGLALAKEHTTRLAD